jgi:hypothetical protein
MRGTLLLAQTEISRLRRNRRYFLFTLALPVVLYLIVAKQGNQPTAWTSRRTTWSRWRRSARSAAR